MTVELKRHRLTVEDYQRMIEVGIITENDKVELINGELIDMSPVGSPHAGCVKTLIRLFNRLLNDKAILSIQDPVQLAANSQPEPDLALLRNRADDYRTSHPTPADIHLIIEVADSSLEYDQDYKLSLYAAAGIPEYWIINLREQRIETYRQPDGDLYKLHMIFRRGDEVTFPELDLAFSVDEILGPVEE